MESEIFVSLADALRRPLPSDDLPRPKKGIPSGIETFDHCLGGLRAGDLVVIAGGREAGKTALALTLAYNIASRDFCGLLPPDTPGESVVFFSLGLPVRQLAMRVLAIQTSIPVRNIELGTFTADQVSRVRAAAAEMGRISLLFNAAIHSALPLLKQAARELHSRSPLRCLLVDDFHLVGDEYGSNTDHYSSHFCGLKSLALELRIPIVVVADLPDWAPSRPDDTPDLSDLMGMKGLHHADIAMTVASFERQFHHFHPEPFPGSRKWLKWRKTARHFEGSALVQVYAGGASRASMFLRHDPDTLRFLDLIPRCEGVDAPAP
ncbi:MAG: DnaB-like helicase C-terminal domain-containing protein [Pseudomonadota bacterium]